MKNNNKKNNRNIEEDENKATETRTVNPQG
jgi:hypothetical protein